MAASISAYSSSLAGKLSGMTRRRGPKPGPSRSAPDQDTLVLKPSDHFLRDDPLVRVLVPAAAGALAADGLERPAAVPEGQQNLCRDRRAEEREAVSIPGLSRRRVRTIEGSGRGAVSG